MKRSGEEQSLPDVWAWYQFQLALIREEKARVLEALASGAALATDRYLGRTRDELEEEFEHQADELGKVTTLGMLACTEAALRIDFLDRTENKTRDEISRAFWNIARKGRDKVRLEEDILDIWRGRGTNPTVKRAVSDFKGALNLRHWLAHGRYWVPKFGRAAGYEPVDVFDICKALLQATDLI